MSSCFNLTTLLLTVLVGVSTSTSNFFGDPSAELMQFIAKIRECQQTLLFHQLVSIELVENHNHPLKIFLFDRKVSNFNVRSSKNISCTDILLGANYNVKFNPVCKINILVSLNSQTSVNNEIVDLIVTKYFFSAIAKNKWKNTKTTMSITPNAYSSQRQTVEIEATINAIVLNTQKQVKLVKQRIAQLRYFGISSSYFWFVFKVSETSEPNLLFLSGICDRVLALPNECPVIDLTRFLNSEYTKANSGSLVKILTQQMHEYYMLVPWDPPSFGTVQSLINDRQLPHSPFEYMQEKIYRQIIINIKDMMYALSISQSNLTLFDDWPNMTENTIASCVEMDIRFQQNSEGHTDFNMHTVLGASHIKYFSYLTCMMTGSESEDVLQWNMTLLPIPWETWVILFIVPSILIMLIWFFEKSHLYHCICQYISILLGIMGSAMKLKVSNTHLVTALVIFWGFIGLLVSNLYQARMVEILIAPSQDPSSNLTFEQMVESNHTFIYIPKNIYERKIRTESDFGIRWAQQTSEFYSSLYNVYTFSQNTSEYINVIVECNLMFINCTRFKKFFSEGQVFKFKFNVISTQVIPESDKNQIFRFLTFRIGFCAI